MNVSSKRPRTARVLWAAVAAVMVAGALSGSASAAPVTPALELVALADDVTLYRYQKQPVSLDIGAMVASRTAPFELHVSRSTYAEPIELHQVLHSSDGTTTTKELPSDLLDGWWGLKDFFEVSVTKPGGAEVTSATSSFCPNAYPRERVSDEGPVIPTFADMCGGNPFTKGLAWGIDHDWAVGAFGWSAPYVNLKPGNYEVQVSITDTYVDLLEIDPTAATATVSIIVEKYVDDCGKRCKPVGRSAVGSKERANARSVPVITDPNPDSLADLAALPAWGISIEQRKKRTFLTFGATVWNAGATDLVVEGYRRNGEAIMDGWQYFYENGEQVGKAQVGTLEFDSKPGHNHWHFLQFAKYSLLDSTQSEIVRSRKEAFCLAPTDAIDMLQPGATRNPGQIGLHTACGSPGSIWVREVLPAGWGDTYFQGLPGQSFNITDLPNGTYYIAVEANPEVDGARRLFETTPDNNLELREIVIGGSKKARTVTVPPWNGIDTEGFDQFGGGSGG